MYTHLTILNEFSLSPNLWIWQSRISQSPKNNENYELKEKLTKSVHSYKAPSAKSNSTFLHRFKSNSTFLFLAYPCPFLRQLRSYVYALKYCTNTVANINTLYMRESGYSLSPLYLKPLLIVGRSVCPSVRLSAGMSNVDIYVNLWRESPDLRT